MIKNIYIPIRFFCTIAIYLMLSVTKSYGQYTIFGNNCVFPGPYPLSPYYISGNIGPNAGAGDKWCITNGTINGNSCYINPGNPMCPGVSWNSGATTGTLSYYRPASASTPVVTITVTIMNPGTIGPMYTAVPIGAPVSFLLTGTNVAPTALCNSGPITYQWQKLVNGVYTNIPGATGKDYTVNESFTQSTTFWRQVYYMGINSYNSGPPCVVDPRTAHNPGTIGPVYQGMNANQTPQILLPVTNPSGGTFGPAYNFYWQSSADNINWQDIPGATNTGAAATGYQPGPLSQTTYYRIRVGNGPLQIGVYTNVATTALFAPLLGGVLSPESLIIPYSSLPGTITGTPATRGMCNGNYVYQWQKSENGIDFTDIVNAQGLNYTPPSNLITTTYYRRKVTLDCNNETAFSTISVIKVADPPENMNYMRERVFKRSGITDAGITEYLSNLQEVFQSTQYYDGLGRTIQKVNRKGSLSTNPSDPTSSDNATDMVEMMEYDNMGREQFKYLSYPSTEKFGTYKTDPKIPQQAFMQNHYTSQNESNFYTQTLFETSPLARPVKMMPQGVSWSGSNRGIQKGYYTNTLIDVVKRWDVDITPTYGVFSSYTYQGEYLPGELSKEIVTDENGSQVIEFRDKNGMLILRKVQVAATTDNGMGSGHGDWLCTYFIYDELNNLRCVIQPRGVELISPTWVLSDADILAEQCFRYEYDSRNRLVMKKEPGKGAIYMVYDNRDRVAMIQDGNLRLASQWLVTLFDNNNRVVETGLWTNSQTLSDHITAALNPSAINYPFTQATAPASGYEYLTRTGYDNYTGLPSASQLNANFNSTWAGEFYSNYNSSPHYAQQQLASTRTQGLATWSQSKVLNSNPVQYLYTVNIYDDRGRLIQLKSRNLAGGEDIVTTQFNFSGQPLIIIHRQEKATAPAQSSTIITRNTYDDLGRLLQIDKKVGNSLISNGDIPLTWTSTVRNEYNSLGHLNRRELGGVPGTPLEALQYDYNIRGWLLGVNRQLFTSQFYPSKFGFELAYDKNNNVVPGQTYLSVPQYNHNIRGMTWRSFGDNEIRKYDYSYDPSKRFLKADFTQYNGGSFNKSAQVDFTSQVGDGQSGTSGYDANGNIKGMKQWGLKLGTSPVIDEFSYNYKLNEKSNKLLAVTESTAIGTSDFKLGDLTDKNRTMDDYDYDNNGNLILDKNKSISSISYNHLNLPQQIIITGRGSITNMYDASGNRLKKTVQENNNTVVHNGVTYNNVTITTTTIYLGGIVYETKSYDNPSLSSLQYTERLLSIPHEEGRIRFEMPNPNNCPPTSNRLVYDYYIKDHLGNIRLVLTEQQENTCYIPATIEDATRNDEVLIYDIKNTQEKLVAQVSGADNYPQFNQKFYRVSGGTPGQKTGLGMAMKVMRGDQVAITVQSYYNYIAPAPGPPNLALSELLTSLVNSNTIIASKGQLTTGNVSGIGDNTNLLNNFISNNTPGIDRPRAFLNWILFDDQLKFADAGSDPVEGGGYKLHDKFLFSGLPVNVKRNGYLYIYVSNETTNIDVYFDNLTVTHKPGPLLEETHYYPFGLTMAGISSKAALKQENKQKFVSQELDKDIDVNWYQFRYRNHDPQIGRFIQVDPLSDKYAHNSTYAYAENRVIDGIDMEGTEYLSYLTSMYRMGYQLMWYEYPRTPSGTPVTSPITWYVNKVNIIYENIPKAIQDSKRQGFTYVTGGPVTDMGRDYNAEELKNVTYDANVYFQSGPEFYGAANTTRPPAGVSQIKPANSNPTPGAGLGQNQGAVGALGANGPGGIIANLYNRSTWMAAGEEKRNRMYFYNATQIVDKHLGMYSEGTNWFGNRLLGLPDRAMLINFLVDGYLPATETVQQQLTVAWYGLQLMQKYKITIREETKDAVNELLKKHKESNNGNTDWDGISKYMTN